MIERESRRARIRLSGDRTPGWPAGVRCACRRARSHFGSLDGLVFAGASLVFVGLAIRAVLKGRSYGGPQPSDSTLTSIVSGFGGWQVLPAATLAIALVLSLAGRRLNAIFLITVVGGVGVLAYAAKLFLGFLGAENRGAFADYPSTHTACTAALAGALCVLVWDARPGAVVRAVAGCAAAIATIGMGLARVLDGRHTPWEVAGGISLAVAWLVCVSRVRRTCSASLLHFVPGGASRLVRLSTPADDSQAVAPPL